MTQADPSRGGIIGAGGKSGIAPASSDGWQTDAPGPAEESPGPQAYSTLKNARTGGG